MQISENCRQKEELICLIRRTCTLLLDYFIWYAIYLIMILILFIKRYGIPEVSGDLTYYKNVFDNIIKTPTFSLIYLEIICFLEIIIPVLANGQSITKKIFRIRIRIKNNSKINLLIRNIVKIIVLNPYGVIAYTIGEVVHKSCINYISDMLGIIFIASSIFVFIKGESFHDKIAKTEITLVR